MRLVLLSLLLLATGADAGEADVRAMLAREFPAVKVQSIAVSELPGFLEVAAGGQVLFVSTDGRFVVDGTVIDTATKRNLTVDKEESLSRVSWSDLPLDLAIKTVRGDGRRVLATFEDPHCGYCRKLSGDLAGMTNFTLYTFMYPILSDKSTRSVNAVWCAQDREGAWSQLMREGIESATPDGCRAPREELLALGRKLRIEGTPTIFFADGSRAVGYLPPDKLAARLNSSHARVGAAGRHAIPQ